MLDFRGKHADKYTYPAKAYTYLYRSYFHANNQSLIIIEYWYSNIFINSLYTEIKIPF